MTDLNDARDTYTETCENEGCDEQFAVSDRITLSWLDASFCSHTCRQQFSEQFNTGDY